MISPTPGILASLGYAPIAVLIISAMVMATVILIITHVMPKPKRSGPEKDATYESGMETIGDARRRFNVRFYLVAMMFLLFDVELVFLYPLALVLTDNAAAIKAAEGAAAQPLLGQQAFLFGVMVIFFVILLVGYAYDWGKGVFRWD